MAIPYAVFQTSNIIGSQGAKHSAMKLKCKKVSASVAGDEIFQVIFEETPEIEDGQYVLVSRAFLEEDEGEISSVYLETHNERMIGHYADIEAKLTRNRFTAHLPPPANELIEVDFTISDQNYEEIKRTLEIIFQKSIG